MPRKAFTADQKLELKHYTAQEIVARTEKGTLKLSTGKGYSALIQDICQKFDIPIPTARKLVQDVKQDAAISLPVHDILKKTLAQNDSLVETLNNDIQNFDSLAKAEAEPEDIRAFYSLKQSAIRNAITLSKANIDLLQKIGGLSIAARKLALDEERNEQSNLSNTVQEQLNFNEMSKEEIDDRFIAVVQSGKTDAFDSSEIVKMSDLIDDR